MASFIVAVIFMPLSTAIMTAVPAAVNIYTFSAIGCGILAVSGCGAKAVLERK